MRRFLENYVLKFEIMNIKQIILGTIIGQKKAEKKKNVNLLVEKLLNNEDFINILLEKTSLDEIQLYLKGTKYYRAVREGLLYYKNYNEVFVLNAFLDQLYYLNMVKEEKTFKGKERVILAYYINSITEIYNLNIIYRGIINKTNKKLLSQFLIDKFLLFDKNSIENLLYQESVDEFILLIDDFFKKNEKIRRFYAKIGINKDHLYWWIEGLYINNIFNSIKPKFDDIEYTTIRRIIEVLIKKQKEIQFDILPNVVKIIHKKYEMLKEGK